MSNPFGDKKVQDLKDVLSGRKAKEEELPEKKQNEFPETPTSTENTEIQNELNALKKELEEAQKKSEEHKSNYVQTLADFENFRKRMEREKSETIKFANERLLQEFIPVYDHLEMTLIHASEAQKKDPIIQGVEMVVKQFLDLLAKHGIQVISGQGQPFNPNQHEAISTKESSEFEPNCVIEVQRKGFILNGRVIRPALVVVVKEEETKSEKNPQDSKNGETIH